MEVAVPPDVVNATTPVTAPAGTINVIDVADTTRKLVTLIPPTVTAETPARLVPVIVTVPPTDPRVPFKDVIVGAAAVAE